MTVEITGEHKEKNCILYVIHYIMGTVHMVNFGNREYDLKVGDLAWCRMTKKFGILIEPDQMTRIGTPFDWLIMWFDGTFGFSDEIYLTVR